MKKIDTLDDSATQTTSVSLDDGTTVSLTFRYLPTVQRWAFDVEHQDLTTRGATLCLHPNILRSWRNVCRFGLAVSSTDGVDPVSLSDFSSGRVSVYVLDQTEINSMEALMGMI
jgi:hypothetical protein